MRKFNYTCVHVYVGTEQEMKVLLDRFEAGEWTPFTESPVEKDMSAEVQAGIQPKHVRGKENMTDTGPLKKRAKGKENVADTGPPKKKTSEEEGSCSERG